MDQIRRAIENAGETPYAIAQGSGVNKSQLSRILNTDCSLSIDSAERVADYLGYQIVLKPKRTKLKAD
jgi:transcriptional regulator with XRE-family HTH domain